MRFRRRGRRVLAVALLATVSAGLGGCGEDGDASRSGQVTIDFLSYNYGTPDIGGQGTQELLDAFHAAHPDITVRPIGVATKDVLTKLRTDAAAGEIPDVAQIGWSKMAEANTSLPVVPVQDVAGPEWEAHVAGMAPGVMNAVASDGKVTAMPYTMSIPIMYVNATLFTRAGLDPERPPTTMAEVEQAALQIKKAGAEGVYIDAANSGKSDFLTQSLIASNGGALVGPDGAVTLDQPAAVEALAALQDLTASGAQPAVKSEDGIAAFKAGKVGMLVTSTALLAALDSAAEGVFDLRTAGFPRFGDKPARPTYSGAGLAVFAPDEARQRAAWTFVKFLTSEQGFTIITTKIGYLPLRESIVNDPRYLADYFAADGRMLPSLGQLATVTPYTSFAGKRANEAVVVLQDQAVEPIMLRGADPPKTMTETAGKIRAMAKA
ncbi:ABC transporter substrate-binding protein [Pseudonocardia sp. DSM 110487]|uniref:ABC transporter substrate-binding protein n=1 Tax=Pseudonocardia sp. DSM 110487 TaxID=2865833 RepID=UPI001C6A5035|nr:ABC transporter substrate-binding protein [Pseudonocardia sp. DSM 110487]QYN39007.1 ABC transporter substrate-binding protein [Pseudonocardia sp. DSM 110487]